MRCRLWRMRGNRTDIGWLQDRNRQGARQPGLRLYSVADIKLGIAVRLGCPVAGIVASFSVRETDISQ